MLRPYIYYSTLFAIFTEAFRYRILIDWKLFYLILFINTFLLLLFNKIKLSKGLLIFYSFLMIQGLITAFFGSNTISKFSAQLIGIGTVSIYFYSFYSYIKEDSRKVINDYCYFSYIIAIIGFIRMPIDYALGESPALRSILLEPAHYSTIILPAFFYTLKNKFFPRRIGVTIGLSILLSGSSLGILGIGLAALIYKNKLSLLRIVFPLVAIGIILTGTYFLFSPFKLRVNDTVKALASKNLSGINLSSYALISNLYVSLESLKKHPFIGSGLGSHELSRRQYLGDLEGIDEFEEFTHLNAKDAGSLFIRVMSDFGTIGVILLFLFIRNNYYSYDRDEENRNYISKAILLYFFCKLFREGHYFSPEMYFFVFLYVINYRKVYLLNKIIV